MEGNDRFPLVAAMELGEFLLQEFPPSDWHGWELQGKLLVYRQHGRVTYDIPLLEITTPRQMLDWIFQLTTKLWARENQCLVGLLVAFADIFDPQGTMCYGNKPLTEADISYLIEHVAAKRRKAGLPVF
jgi:hypothetical protein